jgi:hypothetical protein
MHQLSKAQHEEIKKLAYLLWEERGKPLGSPDDDWFRAEQEFMQCSDQLSQLRLSSLMTEPVES